MSWCQSITVHWLCALKYEPVFSVLWISFLSAAFLLNFLLRLEPGQRLLFLRARCYRNALSRRFHFLRPCRQTHAYHPDFRRPQQFHVAVPLSGVLSPNQQTNKQTLYQLYCRFIDHYFTCTYTCLTWVSVERLSGKSGNAAQTTGNICYTLPFSYSPLPVRNKHILVNIILSQLEQ